MHGVCRPAGWLIALWLGAPLRAQAPPAPLSVTRIFGSRELASGIEPVRHLGEHARSREDIGVEGEDVRRLGGV